MEELMVDRELRARLRQGGQKVVDRFTWPESGRQHLAVYDEVTPA
jgi:glycosyltransferase involved in cell wall biosynthesis